MINVVFEISVSLWLNVCDGNVTQWDYELRKSHRLWCKPEQVFEQTVESPVIWDAMTLTWRHHNIERHLCFIGISELHLASSAHDLV